MTVSIFVANIFDENLNILRMGLKSMGKVGFQFVK